MPTTERTRLKGQSDPGGAPGIGNSFLCMGCATPLLILGFLGLMPFLGMYVITDKDAKVLQPFLTAVGFMLAAFGLYFMLVGIKNFYQAIKYNLKKKRFADTPWKYDYKWDEEGYGDIPLPKVLHNLNTAFLFAAFALPWNMFIFHPEMPGLVMLIGGIFVGAFDLIIVYGLYRALIIFIRWKKYGIAYVLFDHFPYMVGEKILLKLGATQDIGPFEKVVLTLRVIEKVPGTSNNEGTSYFQHYIDTQLLTPSEGILLSNEAIDAAFQLPEDQPGTNLRYANSFFYQLTVFAEAEGVDFKAELLLPVYDKPDKTSGS